VQRSILLKFALFIVAFLFCTYGGSLRADAGRVPSGDAVAANNQTLRVLDTIPQPDAGISTLTEVPDDTTFGALIESEFPINPADPDAIRFEIDDGVHYPYLRDLSSPTMRVVEVIEEDPLQTLIWVVYERALENLLPPVFFPDQVVSITVSVADMRQNKLAPQLFRFKIESDPGRDVELDRIPEYDFIDSDELIFDTPYDSGMEVLGGELVGASIIYNSEEPLTPGFGPVDEIEALNLDDAEGIGAPLNLIPHTVFQMPVKIMIPFPDGTDISSMDIFYHNGVEWLPACDSDGNVLPGGRGWMVAGSRVNHYATSTPLVELQVYHFSATQGGFIVASSGTTTNDDESNHHSGTVAVIKCFIDAAAYDLESLPTFGLLALLLALGALGVLPLLKAYWHYKMNGFYFKQQIF